VVTSFGARTAEDGRVWKCVRQSFLLSTSKGKGKGIAVRPNGTPSHNYGVSLAIWDNKVLPVTRHK